VARSEITIDLGALRANVRRLRGLLSGSELWVVVKANAYGHGALDCARAALDEGATALCVAALPEALELREALPEPRILVFGPTHDLGAARDARVELCVGELVPEDIPVHVKLDTGMGRWGVSELRAPQRNVIGLMTHLATADHDADFARLQIERFRAATAEYAHLTRHAANSAGTLRFPEAHFDAVRCGIAIYGLSPFGTDPADDGLTPVLSWRSELALAKLLRPGESTGYGRKFVAESETWIGHIPVGYADGFRRDMTGTQVLVGDERCRVVGAVSMDALAVELPRELPRGMEVTLVGPGVAVEDHARVADTINWEIVSRIESGPARATRVVV
jgi:alanine racemase